MSSGSKNHGLKLIEMPKRAVPDPPAAIERTPQQNILVQAYVHSDRIKNVAILVHYDDGSSKVLYSVQQELDVWSFVDAIKLQATQAALDFLTPPEPPTKQIS